MKKRVLYPGTFDPVTYGHIDLIKRALKISDEVIVAVAERSSKDILFSTEERMDLLKKATKGLRGVKIESFDGLVVDFAKSVGAHVILRGLRMVSDFEYEFQMALTNRKFNPNIETIFMMPNESYSYLSSRLIKEAVSLGARVKDFVPHFVEAALKKALVK